jgi:hypothetical protein
MPAQREDGFLEGKEGKSSKRLLSVLGWGAALAIAIAGLAFGLDATLVGSLVIAFLTYSLAMQGVVAWKEKK